MTELTDEQIAEEEAWLKGLPRMNWGAFFMPGIWGPAHGFWVSILFYPLWLLVDHLVFGAYAAPEAWKIAIAVAAILIILGITVAFAIVSQPFAAHRAESRGVSRERYLKRERVWTVISLALAIAALAWATYYNLNIRTF